MTITNLHYILKAKGDIMFINENTSVIYFRGHISRDNSKIKKELIIRYQTPNGKTNLTFKSNFCGNIGLACALLSMEKIDPNDISKVEKFLNKNLSGGLEIYKDNNLTRYRVIDISGDTPHYNPPLKSIKFKETFLEHGVYSFPDIANICEILSQDITKSTMNKTLDEKNANAASKLEIPHGNRWMKHTTI